MRAGCQRLLWFVMAIYLASCSPFFSGEIENTTDKELSLPRSWQQQPQLEETSSLQVSDWMRQNNRWVLTAYHNWLVTKKPRSFVLSPLAIGQSLATLYTAADSETAQKISQVLNHDATITNVYHQVLMNLLQNSDELAHFHMDHRYWLPRGYPIRAQFVNLLVHSYLSGVETVNLAQPQQASAKINAAFSVPLVSPKKITDKNKAIVTSVVRLQQRQKKLSLAKTTKKARDKKQTRSQAYLQKVNGQFGYFSSPQIHLLAFPLAEGKWQGFFLWPNQQNISLSQLLANYLSSWKSYEKSLRWQHLTAWLPSLQLKDHLEWQAVLQNTSLHKLFSKQAHFSQLTTQPGLEVGRMIHYASLQWQYGTAPQEQQISAGSELLLTVEQPFCFIVQDQQSKAILLFAGIGKDKGKRENR